VNTVPGAVCTTFNFLHNLRMGPICSSFTF